MYKQTVARKQPHAALAAALIVVSVFALYIVASFLVYLGKRFGVPFIEYLILALLVGGGVFIVRGWLTSYRYALSDSELLLEKYVGARMREREVVPLCAIESFLPYEEGKSEMGAAAGTLRFGYKKRPFKSMVVRLEGARYLILLQPDDTLCGLLADIVHRKDDQNDQEQTQ